MPASLRVAYARGVTPGKWARIWGDRFPRVRLDLIMADAVVDVAAQLDVLREVGAELAFIRLPVDEQGEPAWPGGSRPDDVHFIRLYDERAYVVAPKGNLLEASDEVTTADLDDEVRHPFDDDIQTTVEVVAANVGVVVVPQSIARLHARRDVVARPVTDHPGWCVGLAWLRATDDPRVDDFIGVVRGRTANSSRGADKRTAGQAVDGRRGQRGADGARGLQRDADGRGRGRRAAGRRSGQR